MSKIIFFEKFSQLLPKETMLSFTITYGGLYLTTDGVIFDPNNLEINKFANRGPKSKPAPLGYSKMVHEAFLVEFDQIAKVEVGSFKNLWKSIYTLRLYLKSGETLFFMMPKKETAEKWVKSIKTQIP